MYFHIEGYIANVIVVYALFAIKGAFGINESEEISKHPMYLKYSLL